MEDIIRSNPMPEKTPATIPPLINKLNFNGMAEYGNKVLLGTTSDIDNTDLHTKSYLRHL